MTEIDDDLLDAIEADLCDAVGREQAITSGELATRHCPDDGEAQPTTRKAIKMLMRERGLPVIGCNVGYYIPTSNEPVAEAVQSLQGRIDGIKEKQRLLVDNWAAYRDDSDNDDGPAESTLSDEEIAQIEADPVLELSDFGVANRQPATDGGVNVGESS